MKILGFLAALVLGFATGSPAHAYELLGAGSAPPPPPPPLTCAIGVSSGPSPSGAAAADVAAAGFNTCLLNSDFSSASFANKNNWLGGTNGCGTGSIWINSPTLNTAAPCSDFNIVNDGANGQVLDISYTNADFVAGRQGTEMLSGFFGGPGFTFPYGYYVEARLRWSPNSLVACNGETLPSTGCDLQGLFSYPPPGNTSPFIETDFTEPFMYSPAAGGGQSFRGAHGQSTGSGISFPATNTGNQFWCTRPGDPPGGVTCGSGPGQFDMTQMHTYGMLVTTDGSSKMSVCYYSDRTPGTVSKIGCYNYTGITPATLFGALYSIVNYVGPGSPIPPINSFAGPVDQYQQYVRLYGCQAPVLNGGVGGTSNICSGTLITQ